MMLIAFFISVSSHHTEHVLQHPQQLLHRLTWSDTVNVVADFGEATPLVRTVFVFHELLEAVPPQYLILLVVALMLL